MKNLMLGFPELSVRAAYFAIAAHEASGQTRYGTNEPYYVHPLAVARRIWDETGDDILTAVAALHDVVEDTPIKIEDIQSLFGAEVARMVAALTMLPKNAGTLEERKEVYRFLLSSAGHGVQTVKCADMLHNLSTIGLLTPPFQKKYLWGAVKTVAVLTDAHPKLLAEVTDAAHTAYRKYVGLDPTQPPAMAAYLPESPVKPGG